MPGCKTYSFRMNCTRMHALCGPPRAASLAERCAEFAAELLASEASPELPKGVMTALHPSWQQTRCVVCGTETRPLLDLGVQAPANTLLGDAGQACASFPLGLAVCPGCTHAAHALRPSR